ncbi:hypothetical protein YC2023_086940 [Brassica napus]
MELGQQKVGKPGCSNGDEEYKRLGQTELIQTQKDPTQNPHINLQYSSGT